ncbi:hypothetical protein C8Q77DRAFT_1187051 [Trametes polyzona]|nr:hypothetical protein C8Q77DRAFT_1187051 [Trametes polyzona]
MSVGPPRFRLSFPFRPPWVQCRYPPSVPATTQPMPPTMLRSSPCFPGCRATQEGHMGGRRRDRSLGYFLKTPRCRSVPLPPPSACILSVTMS